MERMVSYYSGPELEVVNPEVEEAEVDRCWRNRWTGIQCCQYRIPRLESMWLASLGWESVAANPVPVEDRWKQGYKMLEY